MIFLSPVWFWVLLFLLLYVLYYRKRGGELLWRFRSLTLLGAAVMTVVALARPALPQKPVDIERRGSDVIFAVDLSRSMQATDIPPTRLEAAKTLLHRVVEADDDNRFGVLAFTTNPIILSPLTADDELLLHLFSGLDPSLVITRGTEIGGALKLARKMSRSPHPIVVLLTDGGDAQGYSQEAAWARANGLVVDVVLLATSGGSTLEDEEGKMLRDAAGGIVVTARNDAARLLAEHTGGEVIEGPDADAVLSAIASQSERDIVGKTKIVLYRELFYWPLALALLLAMLGMTDVAQRLRKSVRRRRHA